MVSKEIALGVLFCCLLQLVVYSNVSMMDVRRSMPRAAIRQVSSPPVSSRGMATRFKDDGIQLSLLGRSTERSVLREMIGVVSRAKDLISFAGGLPAPELFPSSDYAQCLAEVLSEEPQRSMQYGPRSQSLMDHIRYLMRTYRSVDVAPAKTTIILTTGAQQALNLLSALLLDTGSPVVMEEVIYSGIQQAISPYHPEALTVTTSSVTGMDVDGVAQLLAKRQKAGLSMPRFIYAIPNGHNPLGVSMTEEKKKQLVRLARQYHVPIIEDDAYGFLRYPKAGDTQHSATLYELDPEWVFYVGTFSKIMMPALRLGWLIVPTSLQDPVTTLKETSDLESSQLTQRAVARYFDDTERFHQHLQEIKGAYEARKDAMLAAVARHFPEGASWVVPDAGMFVWVHVPGLGRHDLMDVLQRAVEEAHVAFIPGTVFAIDTPRSEPCPQGGNFFDEGDEMAGWEGEVCISAATARSSIRLNFSNVAEDRIEEGVRHLAHLLESVIAGE